MKELSIEQRAKAYDKALSVARKTHQTQPMYRDWLEKMFPELAESEDERIRKVLLNDFKNNHSEYYCDGVNKDMVIAWLEAQGERKPLPSDYDKAFDEFLSHIPEKDPESSNSLYTYEDLESAIQFGIRWQKEQKPAWSKEDAFIDKAAEWLKENIYQRVYKQGDSLGFPTAEFLEEFKKAIKL